MDQLELTNELLFAILQELKAPKDEQPMGLWTIPKTIVIYANRRNGGLWYRMNGEQPEVIEHTALTGYITNVKLEDKTRRGKDVTKLHVFIKGDRPYIIEAGYDTQFSKGLLVAIASLTDEQLQRPITIMPKPGDDEQVLFCRVYCDRQRVQSSYDSSTDFRAISSKVLDRFQTPEKPVENQGETQSCSVAQDTNLSPNGGSNNEAYEQVSEQEANKFMYLAINKGGFTRKGIELFLSDCQYESHKKILKIDYEELCIAAQDRELAAECNSRAA